MLMAVSTCLFLISSCKEGASVENTEASADASTSSKEVAFPKDYRKTFTNYLSLDRVQNHDQIIRLFANDIAMQGLDENGKLPFGSVLVGEVYKAKLDDSGKVMVSSLGRRIRGELVLVAVMEKGEHLGKGHPEELANGHWEFGAFKRDGSFAGKDLNSCRACHAPLKEADHVFSFEHFIKKSGGESE